MSDGTVIFLGAGASKPLNYPLTYEILPLILDRLSNGTLFGADNKKRASIQSILNVMFPGRDLLVNRAYNNGSETMHSSSGEPSVGQANALMNLPLVTDVLSLLDFMAGTGVAASPHIGPQAIGSARQNLEQAIFEVLLPSAENDRIFDAPLRSLEQSAKVEGALGAMHRRHPRGAFSDRFRRFIYSVPKPVTIISTNYDLEADGLIFRDRAYHDIWKDVDFGFAARDPYSGEVIARPIHADFALYKLHGSLNWLRCNLCGHVYVNPFGSIAYLAFLDQSSPETTCHCGFPQLRHLMVAPSFVRDIRESNLLDVWRSALEALRTAARWYILGYSLPTEDIAIRSIILRAYHSRNRSPEVIVVQGSSNTKVRFEMAFEKLEYHGQGIENFLPA